MPYIPDLPEELKKLGYGVLPYVSGSAFEQVIKLLDSMNADERMDVFVEYCTYCGDKDPSCQCWNDE
jgi:uncharacterized protein YebE (UPF0316 family)